MVFRTRGKTPKRLRRLWTMRIVATSILYLTPREVYPLLSVFEKLSFKCDNWLKCDLKAATLEVEENLISVISDTLTQELSKTPQARPSTVKTFTSSIKTQKPTCHKWEITGVRIRGLPEQTDRHAGKLEKDKSAIEDVLTYIGVPASIVDVEKVGKLNEKRARPLIFDVDSVWHTTTILLSLVKLKSYAQNLFISREPNALGRETENESLKKRRELILNNYFKEDFWIRYFKLYKQEDGQLIEAWLAPILFPRIMFTNARSNWSPRWSTCWPDYVWNWRMSNIWNMVQCANQIRKHRYPKLYPSACGPLSYQFRKKHWRWRSILLEEHNGSH